MKTSMLILFIVMSSACSTQAKYKMNEIPMYAGFHQPKVLENKELSTKIVQLGWRYFYQGDSDTAIKRFNQAWMFNRENAAAFWGFGLIMGERASHEKTEQNLHESIKFLTKANELSKEDSKIMVDLAYAESRLGSFLQSKGGNKFQNHFNNARFWYERSEKIDSTFPQLYANWAVLDFYEGKYNEAQNKLDMAKALGLQPKPDFEKMLHKKIGL